MKSKTETRGVGRPESKVIWPKGRFTREQAYQLNGCYEKPARVCKLTVINHLNESLKGKDSVLIRLKDEFGKSTSEAGLGRKPFIYIRRSVHEAGKKNVANLRKAKASTVTVPMTDSTPAPAAPVADATPSVPVTADPVTA